MSASTSFNISELRYDYGKASKWWRTKHIQLLETSRTQLLHVLSSKKMSWCPVMGPYTTLPFCASLSSDISFQPWGKVTYLSNWWMFSLRFQTSFSICLALMSGVLKNRSIASPQLSWIPNSHRQNRYTAHKIFVLHFPLIPVYNNFKYLLTSLFSREL